MEAEKGEAMSLLLQFVYLQILDVLTTIAFLMQGVSESNPVVKWAIREAPHPIGGFLLLKLFAVLLAVYCVLRARDALLRKVNVFFAFLVAYNLVALILASPVLQ